MFESMMHMLTFMLIYNIIAVNKNIGYILIKMYGSFYNTQNNFGSRNLHYQSLIYSDAYSYIPYSKRPQYNMYRSTVNTLLGNKMPNRFIALHRIIRNKNRNGHRSVMVRSANESMIRSYSICDNHCSNLSEYECKNKKKVHIIIKCPHL